MHDGAAADAKHIYACMGCGFSFYVEVADQTCAPEPTRTCPQCGDPGAEFTFMLGGQGRCTTSDC